MHNGDIADINPTKFNNILADLVMLMLCKLCPFDPKSNHFMFPTMN